MLELSIEQAVTIDVGLPVNQLEQKIQALEKLLQTVEKLGSQGADIQSTNITKRLSSLGVNIY